MTRRLRPAIEIVSNIGSLGFDLQQHDAVQIAHAVAILRKVNPDLFAWLVQALGEPPSTNAVDPVALIGQEGATRA